MLLAVLSGSWGTNTWSGPAGWTEDSPGAERTTIFHSIQETPDFTDPSILFYPSWMDTGHFHLLALNTCTNCGDGTQSGIEECDDGNLIPGDGCNEFCQVVVCGNGITEPSEMCDDGNVIPGDGCNAECNKEWECDTSSPVTVVGVSDAKSDATCSDTPASITIEAPEDVEKNDLLMLVLTCATPAEGNIPADNPVPGWTLLSEHNTTDVTSSVFYRVADFGEPDSYTFTYPSDVFVSAVMTAFRNTKPSDPVFTSTSKSTGGYGTSEGGYVPEALTTEAYNTMLALMLSSPNGHNTFNMPGEWDIAYPGGNNCTSSGFFYKLQEIAGLTDPILATTITLDKGVAHLLALNVCEPGCGNNDLDWGEQCDDGNANDGDGCSATCQLE